MGGMGGDSGEGQTVVEVMVPGNKVGLVIGKGGETIRQLQRRGGVKMVIIQDDNIPSVHEKPLRISGDPHKCQRAKEMVLELLSEREMKGGAGGSGIWVALEDRVLMVALYPGVQDTGVNMEDSMESWVSNKGEHSMAMGVQVDGEDTLSNEDTPSNNVGMPVQVKSVLSVDAKSQTALSMKLSV
ncbi:polyribonucleotide nucleotidyltransferase-like [Crassostrea virginica]